MILATLWYLLDTISSGDDGIVVVGMVGIVIVCSGGGSDDNG